jgi:hypothetical protein
MVFVRGALKLPDITYRCWTDSTVSLGWVKGDPTRWKTFVANRVAEIQQLTSTTCWAHCPGKGNPADLLTRGALAEDLVNSSQWLTGPSWLSEPLSDVDNAVSFQEVEQFLKSEARPGISVMAVATKWLPLEKVLEVERWGTFQEAVRVTGWVLRFLHNLKDGTRRRSGVLSQEELSDARIQLFRHIQEVEYCFELKALRQGQSISKSSSLDQLGPFLGSDGLLRVKGRIQHSELSYGEKHPVILPKGHLAVLLIRSQHVLLKHAGVETVITSLRDNYWIIGLRRLMKSVKKGCIPCQRVDAQACNQFAAPLPELRVHQAPPFSVTGLDYAGPLFCLDLPGTKLYILLFTCAVVRAVHLELTESLTVVDCMLAIRRFSARRGLPSVFYSDNATTFTFVAAEKELVKYLGASSPKWKYIAPRSPWWGGWWERLVRSVKGALKKSLGSNCLTRSELETSLQEVEAGVNP